MYIMFALGVWIYYQVEKKNIWQNNLTVAFCLGQIGLLFQSSFKLIGKVC